MARSPRKTPEPKRGMISVAADHLLANPVATGGGIAMVTMAAAIMTNALALQPGAHPAPLFRDTRPVAADPMSTQSLPIPVAKPDDIGQLLGGGASSFDQGLVASIQTELKALGRYQGEVDGLPGPMTSAAIQAFERENGLPEIGEPTSDVLAALRQRRSGERSEHDRPVATVVATVPIPRPAPPRPAVTDPATSEPPEVAYNDPIAARIDGRASVEETDVPAAWPARGERQGLDAQRVSTDGSITAQPVVQRTAEPARMSDPRLARIQESLDLLGFGPIRPDGFWTAETRDAIRRFEENRGLPVTGRISEAFLTELIQIGGLSLN